jgi:endonuclease/exonuclease/phosphatase family metal-dependent hydrolase
MQPLRPPFPHVSRDPSTADRSARRTGAAVLGLARRIRRREPGPGTPAHPAADELRVASYNVHKCVGTDGKFDPGRIAAVVAEIGADLVALQEVDKRFGRRIGLLNVATIERATGLVPLPVSDLPDGLGWHGNTILVRPGTAWRLHRLDLPGAEPRGAVLAELALPGGGGSLRVVAAHFGLLRRCRTRQAAAVLKAVAQGDDMPTLVLGDLNEWRSVGARSALRALEPLVGPVVGGPPSFPSRRPLFALDRVLGCPRARVRSVEAHDTPLARLASDHLPLKAWVRLGAAGHSAGEALAAAA